MSEFNRPLSDELRAKLGVTIETVEGRYGAPLATGAEMRALRAMLRLSVHQMGAALHCSPKIVSDWCTELRPVVPPTPKTAALLTEWLATARELGALDPKYAPPIPERRKTAKSYERPPKEFLYRCKDCGAGGPGKRPLPWHKVRKAGADDQGNERWVHRQKACGPVVQGGLAHRAAVLQERNQHAAPNGAARVSHDG